jgi:sarcosine oxidase
MAAANRLRVVVVGAGAFGGWTALHLVRRGANVTLIDAWGPGNPRASSGGETRIIRATYGHREVYTRLTMNALEQWRDHDTRYRERLYRQVGVLWMFTGDGGFGEASAGVLRAHDIAFDQLTPVEASRRYPQINFDDVSSIYFEPEAGYLLARQACVSVVSRLIEGRGEFRIAAARTPIGVDDGSVERLDRLELADGTAVTADAFVFACGPWMGSLFPRSIGTNIVATRQEIYYFGPPAGDPSYSDRHLPVWADLRDHQMYGIPSQAGSFKVADDATGAIVDPSTVDRTVSAEGVAAARRFLATRFPGLSRAPLVSAEVCQYENTPDSHFIIDRHPTARNVWLVGGGSGHGFKMGPAVGEIVAGLALGESTPDPQFSLSRFAAPPPAGWQGKWQG